MKSPFKFLDSYVKEDRDIFFGREREIEELYHRVFESKIMLVYGVSGTGKSSLIHCGLANKFQETDWLPLVIRRGGNILDNLALAVKAASLTPQTGEIHTPLHFKKAVRSLYLDHYKPVFFIFDQFEELFIFGNKEEKRTFIQTIKTIVDSEIQCRFIFVMREEYMASFTEFERFIPSIFQNRVRIEKMSHINALEAIKGPCKVAGIIVEEGFAETLLEKLSPESGDVELTYLQVFLDRILKLSSASEGGALSFTTSLLSKVGNVSDLLGSFLDEQISFLNNPDTGLAVLKSFVSVKGTKRQMSIEEVAEYSKTLGKPIEEASLKEMIQSFINLRILRDKDENGRFELRHDSLAAKIYEKITLVEKEILEIRQFIENAWQNWQKRKVYLSEDDLKYIAPYESRIYLPSEHSDLVENSKLELTKAKRRRKKLISVAAFLLIIVLSGFTIWALKERNKSIIKERQARANNFNYLSKEVSSYDPTIGLQIARFALGIDSGNKLIHENLTRIYYDNCFYYKAIKLNSSIWAAAFSPDGKTILVGLRDRTAKLLDRDGNTLKSIFGYGNEIRAVAYSPDGKNFLTGDRDGKLTLWNNQGSRTDLFKSDQENTITSATFSPNGKLVVISIGMNAILMDLDGTIKQILKGHNGNIRQVKFSPDGLKILTGSYDGPAFLWDINGKLLRVFKGHLGSVNSVAFSPDGNTILTGSSDLTARLWDLNGNLLQTFSGHNDVIWSVEFSPDGRTILTGSADHTARLYDLQGNILQTLRGHIGEISAFFSPDGKTILTASNDASVKLWNIQINTLQIINVHSDAVGSVAFSSDGKIIFTGGASDERLWDQNGNSLITIKDTTPVFSATLSPDGQYIATSSNYPVVRLWDRNGRPLSSLKGHTGFIYMSTFSPDGKNILTASYDNTARLWDLSGRSLQIFKGHDFSVTSVAFSPDGKYALTGSRDYTARLWDMNGNTKQVFRGHRGEVFTVAFSPDGKSVLTGSGDNTARLWDINGNLLQVLKGHVDRINSVAFSKSGNYVLTGSRDKTAKLWNMLGEILEVFQVNKSYVLSVTFSPDDKTVLIGYEDGTARIYPIKISYEDFLRTQPINPLSTGQKLSYGILERTELIKSTDARQLYEALDYYISEARMQPDLDMNSPGVVIIYELLEKAQSFNNIFENNLKFIDNCLYIYRLKPDKTLLKYIKDTNRKILSFNESEQLAQAAQFYWTQFSQEDTVSKTLEFPETLIYISDKLIQSDSLSSVIRVGISGICSNLSFFLLQSGKNATALKSVLIAIKADSTNEVEYTNLALAYLLNNEYMKAEKVYSKWKDKPWTNDNSAQTFREVFINDISDMESKGITHPDFAKVKELLKK
jgi:WD40 repeat protein